MTPKETEARIDAIFDELMDCPDEEKAGRLVAVLNMLGGFPEGEGWKV